MRAKTFVKMTVLFLKDAVCSPSLLLRELARGVAPKMSASNVVFILCDMTGPVRSLLI